MRTFPLTALCGAAVGAGVMYLLDPEGGSRRRQVAKYKIASAAANSRVKLAAAAENSREAMLNAATDLRSRAQQRLNGGAAKSAERYLDQSQYWTPTTRIVVGSIGAALAGYGV